MQNRTFCRINNSDSSFFMVNLLYSRLFLKKSWKIAVKVVFLWSICASNVRQNQQTLHPSAARFPPLGTSHDNIFTDAHYVRAFSSHDHHRN